MGIAHKFEQVLSHPRLTDRDRMFATSLQNYYEKKKRLTPGRRRCLAQLEERYANMPEAAKVLQPEILNRINEVFLHTEETSWDRGFLESIKSQVEAAHRLLSPKQIDILAKIEGRNSKEEVQARQEWSSKYHAAHRSDALVVANYYANTPYFRDLAVKIITDPEFVPGLKQYRNMCGNKYAKRVLKCHHADPLYPEGSKITGRATAPRLQKNKHGFVLKANASPVVNATKGAKRYLVLFVGDPTPYIVEEKHLKRGRF